MDHLQQSLPKLVAQAGCHVVLVDFSCPDGAGDWAETSFSTDQVTVVGVRDREYFDRSEAKNAAINAALTKWVCAIDADVLVADDFADQIRQRLGEDRFLRRASTGEGVGGTFVAAWEALHRTGLHDPIFQG